jgi:hypothetical protein
MTLSGPEALRSLEDALRDIRREEDEIAKRIAKSNDIVGKLRTSEGELLRQLAAVRLDPETQKDLSGRLGQAELAARQAQQSHADEMGATEGKLAALDKTISELNAKRAQALKEIETCDGQLRALRAAVLPKLDSDADYVARKTAAANLAEIATESLRKTEQAEQDRETKGKPYRDDPLFMYLWEGGYGTATYKPNNLVRYLDGLVARLVNFMAARPNYAMLNEIPLRLREHAERQQQNAEQAQAEVQQSENAAIDAAGGRPIREQLAAAQAAVAEADKAIVAAEDQRDDLAEAQRTLVHGENPALTQALAAFAEALGREDLKTLEAQADATQTGQDDTLVDQIEAARQRASEEQKDIAEHEARLKTLASRRRELEDIQYEFKKSRYDDPRSRFGEDRLAGDMLTEFLRGAMSASVYWDNWRRTQSWVGGGPPSPGGPWGGPSGTIFRPLPDQDGDFDERSPPWSQSGGGFQWPDSSFAGGGGRSRGGSTGGFGGSWGRGGGFSGGGRSGGGGFSRPRTGSSGTRSHGGFKTGGGF